MLDQKSNPISWGIRWFNSKRRQKRIRKFRINAITRSDKKELDNLESMASLGGGEEEVKEGKELKILTPNKLLLRFLVFLAQIKPGNNSQKLKEEIRQMLCLLYQHNKITKKFATI